MGRISQAFSLAERYVRAYECYVEETVRRYHDMRATEQRNAASSERMAEDMSVKVRADKDLVPELAELGQHIAALVKQLGGTDWGQALDAVRSAAVAALPNGKAEDGT